MRITHKTFVVTGAGGGIGSELTLQLLARGAQVVAVDLSSQTLDALAVRAGDTNARLRLQPLNITDRDAVLALPAQHGDIDGVINCAGIIQPFVKVRDLEFAAIERVMNVNFYGTLNVTKAFLPSLLERPETLLCNVSSMGGFLPVPGQSVYGASKAAVKLLSEGLYAELQGTNVHVCTVFPGATATDITKNSGVATPTDASAKQQSFPMLSAHDAATEIIRGIERNKPQIFTGRDSKLMNRLYRLAPVRATRLIASQMKSLLK